MRISRLFSLFCLILVFCGAFDAHAAIWERRSGAYTPTNNSVNIDKWQEESAVSATISSVKMDGEFNHVYQALNDIEARTAPSVIGKTGLFLTNDGSSSFWGLISSTSISSAGAAAGLVLQANGSGSVGWGTISASTIPANISVTNIDVSNRINAGSFAGSGAGLTNIALLGSPGRSALVVRTDLGASTTSVVSITANFLTVVSTTGQVSSTGAVSTSANVAVSGIGGRDSGTNLTSNTWLAVYVVRGVSGTAAMLSSNTTAPILTQGYSYYQRVGMVRTDSTNNGYLLKTLQYNDVAVYVPTASTNTPRFPQMWSGARGTTGTSPVWAAQDISAFVPPTAMLVKYIFNGTASTNAYCQINSNNVASGNSSTNPPLFGHDEQTGGGGSQTFDIFLTTPGTIYAACLANTAAYAYGWRDNL